MAQGQKLELLFLYKENSSGTFSIMVIIRKNGISDPSSNPG